MGASMKDQVLEREAEISVGARKVRGILVLPPAASAVVALRTAAGAGDSALATSSLPKSFSSHGWELC